MSRLFAALALALFFLSSSASAQVNTGAYLGGRVLTTDPSAPASGQFRLYNKNGSWFYRYSGGAAVPIGGQSIADGAGSCNATLTGPGTIDVCSVAFPASATALVVFVDYAWVYSTNVISGVGCAFAYYKTLGMWTSVNSGSCSVGTGYVVSNYWGQAHGPGVSDVSGDNFKLQLILGNAVSTAVRLYYRYIQF